MILNLVQFKCNYSSRKSTKKLRNYLSSSRVSKFFCMVVLSPSDPLIMPSFKSQLSSPLELGFDTTIFADQYYQSRSFGSSFLLHVFAQISFNIKFLPVVTDMNSNLL